MENVALVPYQTGSGFSQQGTLDWTQLARSSVSLSLEILSRLSQAGVEPLTLAIGQAISSRFLLQSDTQRTIQAALGSLRPFSSYGNILWFGFGVKHVARLLVESEQGMACIALCGGLSVSYDRFYCAQVLRSMTQLQSAPRHLSPSISQWSNLVDVCSGTLLSSNFPNIVEGFARLWYNAQNQDIWKQRGATSPHALGAALSTLADISCGTLERATFVGGADCAWIAAVAEWVLYLTVEVQDAETGQRLYRKVDNPKQPAQVTILRTFDTQYSIVRLRDKTCFLSSGSDIFHATTGIEEKVFAGGRSSWDSILADTFPADALRRLFSSEAGCAFSHLVRVFAVEVNCALGTGRDVLDILPELGPVLSRAPRADLTTSAAVNVIHSICACTDYHSPFDELGDDALYLKQVNRRQFCIYRMATTILHYLWIIAHVQFEESIHPSPSGLRHLYFSMIGLSYQQNPYVANISQNRKNNVLTNILHILTGIPVQGEVSLDASAISESGMSICCTSLLDPNLPPTGRKPFCLVRGHIQKDDTLFREVYDLDSRPGLRLEEYAVTKLNFDEKLRLIMSTRQTKSTPELQVKETIEGRKLQANYSWHCPLADYQREPVPHPSANHLVTAFGCAELQRQLFEAKYLPVCENRQVRVMTRHNTPLAGVCYRVTEDIYQQLGPSPGFPSQPGEWCLLDLGICRRPGGYQGEESPTRVYTGSLVELYSLLCNSEPGKNLKLVQVCAPNCFFCTCMWASRTIIAVSGQDVPMEIVLADDITLVEPSG
ncbi:hypothetical protein BDV10DRAFT_8672 [Aspergillus recurvatus]